MAKKKESTSKIILTGEHILVRFVKGSPIDYVKSATKEAAEPSHTLIYIPESPMPPLSCMGEILDTGPHPFVKDDFSEKEDMLQTGDIVIFAPTSGFAVDSPKEDKNAIYRIMAAGVVAAYIRSEAATVASKHSLLS